MRCTHAGYKKSHSCEWLFVGPLGLEPRLFWTKTRRVASYTMGQLDMTRFYQSDRKTNNFFIFLQACRIFLQGKRISFVQYPEWISLRVFVPDLFTGSFFPLAFLSDIAGKAFMVYLAKTPWWIKPLYRNLIWSVPTCERVIYLTFDDGPVPEVTPQILDMLDQYRAKATFFCIGDNVQKHPAIFEAVRQKGHGFGNHTFSHLNGWKTSDVAYFRDVLQCADVFGSRFFRPPYGRIRRSQAAVLKKHFYIVMWDVLSGDFDQRITPEKCLQNVIGNATEGSVVVFHDSIKAKANVLYALPEVLEHFTQKGYVFKALEAHQLRPLY